jgi:hypothetical protein
VDAVDAVYFAEWAIDQAVYAVIDAVLARTLTPRRGRAPPRTAMDSPGEGRGTVAWLRPTEE